MLPKYNLILNLLEKIPTWLKLIFNLIFWTLIILKLICINVANFLNKSFYLKIYSIILFCLGIIFLLILLGNIFRYSKGNVQISELWPEFFIDFLSVKKKKSVLLKMVLNLLKITYI